MGRAIDDDVAKRRRAMERKLRDVETLPEGEVAGVLGAGGEGAEDEGAEEEREGEATERGPLAT